LICHGVPERVWDDHFLDYPTIAQALQVAQAHGLERLDAQLLLLHALNQLPNDRVWLLTHDRDTIGDAALQRLDALVARRKQGEPLAYITGHKEFFGLDLMVDERVLVPRPETETLVEWALELLPRPLGEGWGEGVLDLGTGSGAIALAIKHSRSDVAVTALDTSAEALTVARANAQRLQLDVHFWQGSWLAGVAGRFQIIVSNPPYIAAQDSHLSALTFEPLHALVSGADGLDDLRRIITQAPAHLLAGGWLLLEHGYDQAQALRTLLQQAGFEQVQSRRDLAGLERCSGGRLAQD
jgi:release factor glutamine methyltransferase